ncbi:hypothetical protein IMY05_C4662000400 [Salix suchowensis]|nr:hypothetical protein IMY05_C4662000400 [Salix suchowensis]
MAQLDWHVAAWTEFMPSTVQSFASKRKSCSGRAGSKQRQTSETPSFPISFKFRVGAKRDGVTRRESTCGAHCRVIEVFAQERTQWKRGIEVADSQIWCAFAQSEFGLSAHELHGQPGFVPAASREVFLLDPRPTNGEDLPGIKYHCGNLEDSEDKYGDEADPRVLSFVDDIGAHLPKSVGALEYARWVKFIGGWISWLNTFSLRIHQNLIPTSDDAIKDMPVVVQYVDSKGAAEAPITVDTDKTESAFVVPQLATDTPSPPLEEGEVCTLTLTVDLDVEDYDERPLHLTFKAEPLADGRLPIPPFTWVVDAKLRQFLIEQDQIQREKRQLAAKKGKGKQREVPEEPTDSRDTLPVTIVIIKPSTRRRPLMCLTSFLRRRVE